MLAALLLACASDVACLSWTPPTTNTNGTQITYPLRYDVYRQTGPAAWQLQITVSQNSANLTGLPKGQQCFRVVVVNADTGAASAPSNVACKTLKVPAPTDGSIEAPTDGSIELP